MKTLPVPVGRLTELRALTPNDAAALLASITSDEVWAWKPVPKPTSVKHMHALIEDVLVGPNGDRYPFSVVRRADRLVIGSTTLHTLDVTNLTAEIGWTWLDRRCWGQGYNEDVKRALLRYCFGPLGLARVQCTVDVANLRSQRSLERIGFIKEGILRSHRVRIDNSRADTVVYSLLAGEWPATDLRIEELINERQGPRSRTALEVGEG